jgi:transposase
MRRSRRIHMELVVIGMENGKIIEELRRRGVKVILVPGNEIAVYMNFPHSGFQELVGEAAKRYVSLLVESPYTIEHY